MKKFFSFILAVVAAMTVSASTDLITFGEEAVEKGTWSNEKAYTGANEVLSLKLIDPDGKMSIDLNNAYFGTAEDYVQYGSRLKTGGKSSSSKNYMEVTATEAGNLLICVRTGSNSDSTRTVVLANGTDTLLNEFAKESKSVEVMMEGDTEATKVYQVISVGIEANVTYRLSYPINGVNFYSFGFSNESPEPEIAKPENAPAAPEHAEEDVMALYCNHYTTNNLNFYVLGWGGIMTWETLTLDGTDVMYCQDMKWEIMKTETQEVTDFSGYEKLHFDVWVPEVRHVKLTFETATGAKPTCDFRLNAGWNTIDADPAWWSFNEEQYDFTDVKFLIFEGLTNDDEERTSAEGTPFAFTNIYFWKSPAIDFPEAPEDPTMAEAHVKALFARAYPDSTLNFAPTSWGSQWKSPADQEGTYFYTPSFGWDAFTNWDNASYDLSAYDMLAFDLWVEVESNIKVTIEALGAADGGSGWKNGTIIENLQPNQWNQVVVDLLNDPFTSYEFTDAKYLILEGFKKADGSSAEGTPVAITNAYFYNSMHESIDEVSEPVQTTKRIENGRLIIERNGIKYNVTGAIEK